jgi:hypothetical protein
MTESKKPEEIVSQDRIYENAKAYSRVDIYRYRDKWLSKELCA